MGAIPPVIGETDREFAIKVWRRLNESGRLTFNDLVSIAAFQFDLGALSRWIPPEDLKSVGSDADAIKWKGATTKAGRFLEEVESGTDAYGFRERLGAYVEKHAEPGASPSDSPGEGESVRACHVLRIPMPGDPGFTGASLEIPASSWARTEEGSKSSLRLPPPPRARKVRIDNPEAPDTYMVESWLANGRVVVKALAKEKEKGPKQFAKLCKYYNLEKDDAERLIVFRPFMDKSDTLADCLEKAKKGESAKSEIIKARTDRPSLSAQAIADQVGTTAKYAQNVLAEAGLPKLTHAEVIAQNHIKVNDAGKPELVIDGNPATQQAVADLVGCGQQQVAKSLTTFATGGKSSKPKDSVGLAVAKKSYRKKLKAEAAHAADLSALSDSDREAFDKWRAAL